MTPQLTLDQKVCLIQRPGLAAQSGLILPRDLPLVTLSLSFPEVPAPLDISVNTSSVRRPTAASTYAWLSGQVRAVFSHPPRCPDVDGFLLASFCSSKLSPRTCPSPAVEDMMSTFLGTAPWPQCRSRHDTSPAKGVFSGACRPLQGVCQQNTVQVVLARLVPRASFQTSHRHLVWCGVVVIGSSQ